MKLQFSILRLLLAVPMFACPFALFRPEGMREILAVLMMAIPLALLALTAKWWHLYPLSRMGILALLGAILGSLCCPMISPPYESGDEIPYVIVGALFGIVIYNAFDNRHMD